MARSVEEWIGRQFGDWIVVGPAPNIGVRTAWLCKCSCGMMRAVITNHLMRGTSASCGQHRKKKMHPVKPHPLYETWCRMIGRCENSNGPQYKDYGGRGITVCAEWRNDFWKFVADMGPRPSPKHSIDRANNDLGYSKENCRWATAKEQSRNRRGRHLVIIDGEQMPLSAAVEKFGGNYHTVKWRLYQGQSIKEALKL